MRRFKVRPEVGAPLDSLARPSWRPIAPTSKDGGEQIARKRERESEQERLELDRVRERKREKSAFAGRKLGQMRRTDF